MKKYMSPQFPKYLNSQLFDFCIFSILWLSKSRNITLLTKVHLIKAMVFPVVMYGCDMDCQESWGLKNLCFWTVVLEKTLEGPLDCKEIQPIHSKWDQPWDFFGRDDAKAETPVFWPPHAKSWLIGKDSNAGRDWGQEENGTTEDEMPGWHHWLDGRESEWTPGVDDGQGGLACLPFMRLQRVWHDWATELSWTDGSSWAFLGKESACNVRDLSSIFGSERSHGERNGYLVQYSCLENSMDRGAWRATVHGIPKSWTLLNG